MGFFSAIAALFARGATPDAAARSAELSVPTVVQEPTRGIDFSPELIRQGFPACADPVQWAAAFTAASARFPAINRTGWACILAKAATEAKGLTRWDEDLYYTTAAQVQRMFGARAGDQPEKLLRNPKLLGDTVYAAWGGYEARGLGVIQVTTLANQQAFARDFGMTLAEARSYMLTIPGAAMTAPWYLQHFGAVEKANAGDMKSVLAAVAGKTVAELSSIWGAIHGDQQMADFEGFRKLLS